MCSFVLSAGYNEGRGSSAVFNVHLWVAASHYMLHHTPRRARDSNSCTVLFAPPPCCSPCPAQCLLRYSMTTAAADHLILLANENGGGFNVQPGQQQAGGTVESTRLQPAGICRDTTGCCRMHTQGRGTLKTRGFVLLESQLRSVWDLDCFPSSCLSLIII